jgi:hypothetical protein
MKKLLTPPWKDNPSNPDSFYEEKSALKEFVEGEILEEEYSKEGELDEDMNERRVEEIIQSSKNESTQVVEESSDPYSQLLKDLR